MKNLKFSLLITISVLLSPATFSEESDATWEETLDFIESKGVHLDADDVSAYSEHKFDKQVGHFSIKMHTQEVTPHQIKLIGYINKHPYEYTEVTTKINLYKLSRLRDFRRSEIPEYWGKFSLETTGKDICTESRQVYPSWDEEQRMKTSFYKKECKSEIDFDVDDVEMEERLINALRHLVKLSKEQRQEAKKNYNEKF